MRDVAVTNPSFKKISRSSSEVGAYWVNVFHPQAGVALLLNRKLLKGATSPPMDSPTARLSRCNNHTRVAFGAGVVIKRRGLADYDA